MKLKYSTLLLIGALLAACSKDETPEQIPGNVPETIYSTFIEKGEVSIPVTNSAAFEPRTVRVCGDTLFVANTAPTDRAVYLVSRSSGQLLGKISQWKQEGKDMTFASEITDVAITTRFIYIGQTNPSQVVIFDRRHLKFVNIIGCKSGYGGGILQMTHCYGIREWGDHIMVRDLNTIRGYWEQEAITELPFNVPWIGKVNGADIGFEYYQQASASYKEQLFFADRSRKSIQVITPRKMEVVWGEETHIQADAVFALQDISPTGLAVSGGSLLVSSGGAVIRRYNLSTGTLTDTIARFDGKQIGRMEVCQENLYYIDLKTKKIMLATGAN